jgi:hypothetical protein
MIIAGGGCQDGSRSSMTCWTGANIDSCGDGEGDGAGCGSMYTNSGSAAAGGQQYLESNSVSGRQNR